VPAGPMPGGAPPLEGPPLRLRAWAASADMPEPWELLALSTPQPPGTLCKTLNAQKQWKS